mmetsp:Transcript_103053/g.291902  ORF Transcript_103053/g.291902 Transcript_103053/m.291902 type:complete len:520 (-) Transcript_103053:106-1665(-)
MFRRHAKGGAKPAGSGLAAANAIKGPAKFEGAGSGDADESGPHTHGGACAEIPQTEWTLGEQTAHIMSLGLVDIPGEEFGLFFLEDTLSNSTLPPPWVLCRDEHGRIFFFNKMTGASAWQHPFEPVLKELVSVCRVSLTLPASLRDACITTLQSTWKEELSRSLEEWYVEEADDGQQYYCNRETSETTWEHPSEMLLARYSVKLAAVDWLRDDDYIRRLHQRIQERARGAATSEDTLTEAGSAAQGMIMPGRRGDAEIRPGDKSLQVYTNYDDFSHANQIKAAHEFQHGFKDAVKTLMQQVEMVEQKQAADSARAEAGEAKVVRQIAVVQSQLEKTMDLLRAPRGLEGIHVPETERWWWSCSPLRVEKNSDAEQAYVAGIRSALERGEYRTSMYSGDELAAIQERPSSTGTESRHLKEEPFSTREAELVRREAVQQPKMLGTNISRSWSTGQLRRAGATMVPGPAGSHGKAKVGLGSTKASLAELQLPGTPKVLKNQILRDALDGTDFKHKAAMLDLKV